jgi:XTP/dITP diphosphohydrolase
MLMREKKCVKVSKKGKGKAVFFATNNIHKFNEVRGILSSYGIAAAMLRVKSTEIQSDDISEIASASAGEAFGRCRLPLIVEDAGLFVDELNGFPGPYSAYVYKTLGNLGLLKLLEGAKDRNAKFCSAIVYIGSDVESPVYFEGDVSGRITSSERKKVDQAAFGFDPIFQPEGSEKTFAEMFIQEKNEVSHRAIAIHKFAKWYASTNVFHT